MIETKIRLHGLFHRSYALTVLAAASLTLAVVCAWTERSLEGTLLAGCLIALAAVSGSYATATHKRVWVILQERLNRVSNSE